MSLNRESLVKKAISQIGYTETGKNHTKYAEFFDTKAWQYFNTKKQGSAWCSIFLHWLVYQLSDQKICRSFFCEPSPSKNCGAGVKYLYEYMKKHSKKIFEAEPGDIIFLNDFAHVGLIEKKDSKKIYTIEGNSGDRVKRHSYSLTSKKISSVASGVWPKTEKETSKHVKEEKVIIRPTAAAASFNRKFKGSYTLIKNTALMTGIARDPVQAQLEKGTTVVCYGFYTGSLLYVRTAMGHEGFILKSALKEV